MNVFIDFKVEKLPGLLLSLVFFLGLALFRFYLGLFLETDFIILGECT